MGLFKRKERKKTPVLRLLIVTAVLLLLARTALNDELKIVSYTVSSPLVEGRHIYAVAADLHATYYGDDQRELIEAIIESGAEAVLVPGDLLDDGSPEDGAHVFLAEIYELGLPVYFVTGNHECSLMELDEMRAWCEEHAGVTLLSEKAVELPGNIRLIGLDDPNYFKHTMTEAEGRKLLDSLDPSSETFDLLLAHRPEYAEAYAAAGFDLTLCGHAHGGQLRIPLLLNGLFAPSEGWFPKYAGGRYDIDGRTVIVSRGLMRDDLPRVFNRPELVIVTVEGK